MKKLLLISLFSVFSYSSFSVTPEKYDWNGVEVIFLEDNRFPTYNVFVYFADGALSDIETGRYGETSATFNLLDTGTRRFGRKEISEILEFYGASFGGNVTHEYSTYSVAGLIKDVIPTMKKICHVFDDSIFPKDELQKEIVKAKTNLQNMVNDHSSLANRVFREKSLSGSPYSYPVSGKLKDYNKIDSKKLKMKLEYFNKTVKKRIYLSGPKELLSLKEVFKNDCKWSGSANFSRDVGEYKYSGGGKGEIYLVPVPHANQAQVRLGRFLGKDEIDGELTMELTSDLLGGGFTSKLMRELRVKRGLTYSAYSFAGVQKDYGRSGITTFTKNETIGDLVKVIQDLLKGLIDGNFTDEELEKARGHLLGSYPFKFEKNSAYISQLVFLDHKGKSYDELTKFNDKVKAIKKGDVVKSFDRLFGLDKMDIYVIGNKDLKKELEKYGKVTILDYKKFL